MTDATDYYAHAGPVTQPGEHAARLAELPDEVPGLCRAIRGLVLHRNWAARYGVDLPPERFGDAQARTLPAILDRVLALDDRPLGSERAPADRFMGTCRDYSVLLAGALRQRGVPARARCGFGSYFEPNRSADHWVVEHWSDGEGRWIWTDAQIDDFQAEALKLDFDPLDLPPGRFITGGQAWKACESGAADAEAFGIFDMWGLWFVRGNVVRDFAALNKVELLPWDGWGMLLRLANDQWPEAEGALLDRAAALAEQPDEELDALRELYESSPDLRCDGTVFNYQTNALEKVPAS